MLNNADEDKSVIDRDDNSDDDDDDEKDPMVRKDEEADMYRNYTIQTLHAPRQNEKATYLYQMLCITEPTIDGRCKQLNQMCFPDLFPFGVGGMHYSREVSLKPSDCVKTIIQSCDPRFRLNQQFLFFLFIKQQYVN